MSQPNEVPTLSCDSFPATRPSLLFRLRHPNDADSWNQFVDIYGPVIYRYVRRRGIQHDDAMETMQDVFVQVFQSIGTFQSRSRSWSVSLLVVFGYLQPTLSTLETDFPERAIDSDIGRDGKYS